jgi:hypothetical protein
VRVLTMVTAWLLVLALAYAGGYCTGKALRKGRSGS